MEHTRRGTPRLFQLIEFEVDCVAVDKNPSAING